LLRRFEMPIADIEPMLKNVDLTRKGRGSGQRWVARTPTSSTAGSAHDKAQLRTREWFGRYSDHTTHGL